MKDLILKYQDKTKYDLSCSETILYAANELYDLNLDINSFHMMAPFSGGMFTESVCGIVTAGLSVLGIIFTKDVAHQSPLLKEASKEYINRFNDRLGNTVCFDLKKDYRDETTGCKNLIVLGGEILEEIINEYQQKSFI